MAYVDDLEALQCTLRYRFKDVQILENALTFKSEGTSSFERLEFLGDGILGNLIETSFSAFRKLKTVILHQVVLFLRMHSKCRLIMLRVH